MVGKPSAMPAPIPSRLAGIRAGQQKETIPDRNKLHESVVEFYEAEILSGKLRIGDRLPSEAEIARTFNVSTRTIRDALQILETKGLVRRKHGERANVVRDDVGEFLGSLALTVKQLFSNEPKYLVQLMDVRRIIELDVVGRLASEGGQVNEEVERALSGMREAADTGDFTRVTTHDAEFHLGLVHSIANEILHVLYENLYALIIEVIRVSSRVPNKSLDTAYAEHAEIYRLIRNKDAGGAKDALLRHIEGSSGYLRVALGSGKIIRKGKK
jgi:DNA-binding FadR family transcriptional regulator